MCEVTEYYINLGVTKGEIKGEAKGLIKGEIRILSKLVKQGIISISVAAEQLNLTVEEFTKKQEEYIKEIH